MSRTSLRLCLGCAVTVIGLGGCAPGSVTGGVAEPCDEARCAELGKNCGEIVVEGCGIVSCGECETGQTCGSAGAPNECGAGTCTPTTCQAQDASCGTISDGCTGVLDCGECSSVPEVETPVFLPPAAAHVGPLEVSIATATPGATIYYTMGSSPEEPTESSTAYAGALTVSATTTLAAKAFKAGMSPSATATASYTIIPPCVASWQCETPPNGYESDGCGNIRGNAACGPGPTDTVQPVIAISSPTNGQTVTTSTVTVSGTASDNVAVAKVEVKVGAGAWQLASGTGTWSKLVTLLSGANTIYARAVDTSGNVAQASAAVTYTAPGTLRGVSDAYWQVTYTEAGLKARIDLAKTYSADMYRVLLFPAHIAALKVVGSVDYIQYAINYAHGLGIKLTILLAPYMWAPKTTSVTQQREDFKNSLTYQNKFLSDMVWVATHYNNLDALILEEPHQYTQNISNATFWNAYFKKLHDALLPVLNERPNFQWGFNFISTNTDSQVLAYGIDINYINTNKLFRAVYLQNYSSTLDGYKNHILRYRPKFTNIEIGSTVYLHSSLYTTTTCTTNYDQAVCWNQAVFQQIEYANNNKHAVSIFILGRLSVTAINKFPLYASYTTAGDVVRSIWLITQ